MEVTFWYLLGLKEKNFHRQTDWYTAMLYSGQRLYQYNKNDSYK